MIKQNNVNDKLPENDDCEIPYLVAYLDWEDRPDNCFEDDKSSDSDLLLDFGYYYGNNHWKKNDRWSKIWVKYWI